jgi:hypothetical protein
LLLKDDSAFIYTNEVHGREALLYNFRAREFPEGDGAAEEFYRTWGKRLLHLAQGLTLRATLIKLKDFIVSYLSLPSVPLEIL